MPEGLRIVVDADTTKAEAALKSFSDKVGDAGDAVSSSLGAAFDDLKKRGLVSVASIEAAMKELKQEIKFATDPADINKFNQALSFLSNEQKKLSVTGLPEHLEGVSRGAIRATNSTLGLARMFQAFPPEVLHLTHSFDQLLLSYESIRASSGTSGEAFKKLGEAMIGPVGIGIAISVVVGLLETFGGELFNSKEATEASEAALKSFEGQIDNVKKSVQGLTSALQFQNELGALNIKIQGQTDLQNLSEKSVAQQKVVSDLEAQRDKLLIVDKQIRDNEEINDKDREAKAKKNADALAEIDNTLLEATRKRDLIFREIALQRIEDQKKANDEAIKAGEKFIADTIAQAKRLATFLDKNTQFNVRFEVDPADTTAQTFKKAQDFIRKTQAFFDQQSSKEGIFSFKPLVPVDFHFKINEKFLEALPNVGGPQVLESFDKIKDKFEKRINEFAKNNPILLEFQVQEKTKDVAIKNQSDLASALGLSIQAINSDTTLTDIQKQAVGAAKAVKDVLTPAFEDLFTAIKAGQDPLEAFFKGIANQIDQLIQKLLSAAVEALILSAIFPTGVGGVKGFGGFFKNILGFAEGGIVSGPTLALIGEGAGTSRSNPEVVAPLDQLQGILGSSGGSGNVRVTVGGRLRGRDMILQNSRTTRQQAHI